MLRSSRSKGQWFILSAVMATGVFLAISALFKTYSTIDTSDVARTTEGMYFSNIGEQFSVIASQSACPDIDRNLREFRAFYDRRLTAMGYAFFLNYTQSVCAVSTPGILLASNRMVLCQNVNVGDILPNITLSCRSV